MGRMREGQYFCFCLDHVREYNASYNYFQGMTDSDVAQYQKEAVIGHRPTWTMGVNRSARGFREDGVDPAGYEDHIRGFRPGAQKSKAETARKQKYGVAALKALSTLDLDDSADAEGITARYKELVKRHHPDANGGDRSSEDLLQEIIRAYNHLKSVGLV